MRQLVIKLCAFFCLLLLSSPAVAIIDTSDQEIASQAIPFIDALSAIDAQLQESSYREQLYYLISDEGIHRLLIVNNPQHETIKRGMLSVKGCLIVGYERGFPNHWMDQIKLLIDAKQITSVFYSGGTYNGKTTIELFGY